MIEASELRIGNIIWESNSFTPGPEDYNEIIVASINDIDKVVRDEQGNGYSYDALYYIPITPEWLKKFGFVSTNEGDDFHNNILCKHPSTDYLYCEDGCFVDNGGYYGEYCDIGDIQYVHQIQNLYFAMHGEELEIKL